MLQVQARLHEMISLYASGTFWLCMRLVQMFVLSSVLYACFVWCRVGYWSSTRSPQGNTAGGALAEHGY